MIFHSLDFLIFLPALFFLYWSLGRTAQNLLLLGGSYFFYGYVHPWYLALIFSSTVVDYFCGRGMRQWPNHKKALLITSIAFNLGMLGVFKYYGFFVDNVSELLLNLGLPTFTHHLEIILPVGISFYTFQTLSYTIDIYKDKLEPRNSFLDVAVFVAFFPQLVAGPIERAERFLPQVESKRSLSLDQFERALVLISWGLFKKLVIADSVAVTANQVFSLQEPSFPVLWVGVLAFCVQIYADFSAYTDIARGSAYLFGFRLMENFNHPYIAKSPSDFWRRWHISLSTWFRDYVYIPLGGSRSGRYSWLKNILITFLLSGLWHGASWNFVIWGAYHAALLIGERVLRVVLPKRLSKFNFFLPLQILFVFILVNIGWFIFREENIHFVLRGLSLNPFSATVFEYEAATFMFFIVLAYSLPLVLHTALHLYRERTQSDSLFKGELTNTALNSTFVCSMIFGILFLRSQISSDFIYFQF